MNIGVIVGKFQGMALTEGHRHLIQRAYNENDSLVIFILDPTVPFSYSTPLPYEVVEKQLLTAIKNMGNSKPLQFYKLRDQKYGSEVVNTIDDVLLNKHGKDNVYNIYGGPDSFVISKYNGFANVKEVDRVHCRFSSEHSRKTAYELEHINAQNMLGVIHAVAHREPVCNLFICQILYYGYEPDRKLFALKQPGYKKYCLPLIRASERCKSLQTQSDLIVRKTFPEAKIIQPAFLLDTYVADDWRYRNSEDWAYYALISHVIAQTPIPSDYVKISSINIEEWEDEFHPALERIKAMIPWS